jgi:hypothetical protein
MPPRETLATVASRPISEALAVFHPCMCGLRGGAAAVAVTLIGYDDRGGCCWETREEMIMIDYFLYTDAQQRWIAAPTLLSLLSASSGNDDL